MYIRGLSLLALSINLISVEVSWIPEVFSLAIGEERQSAPNEKKTSGTQGTVEANHFGKCKRKDCNIMLLSGDKTTVNEKDNFTANAIIRMLNVDRGVRYVLWF